LLKLFSYIYSFFNYFLRNKPDISLKTFVGDNHSVALATLVVILLTLFMTVLSLTNKAMTTASSVTIITDNNPTMIDNKTMAVWISSTLYLSAKVYICYVYFSMLVKLFVLDNLTISL